MRLIQNQQRAVKGFTVLELTFALLLSVMALTAVGTITLSLSTNGKRMETIISKNLAAFDAANHVADFWKRAGGGKMSPLSATRIAADTAHLLYYSDDASAPGALPIFSSAGSTFTVDDTCAQVTTTYGWEVGVLTAVFGDASDYSTGIMPVGVVSSIVDSGTMCNVTLTVSVPNIDSVWAVSSTVSPSGQLYLSPVKAKRFSVGSNGFLYETSWTYVSGTGVVRSTNALVSSISTFSLNAAEVYWASLALELDDSNFDDVYGTEITITYDQSLIAY